MRHNRLSVIFGLALVVALAGCTSDKAPGVTPDLTPTHSVAPGVTPGAADGMPDVTDNANYEAGGDGRVEGSAPPAGTVTRRAGDAVRNAVDDTGRAIRDTADNVGRAVRDAGR